MGDIQMLGKSQAAMFRGEKPVERPASRLGGLSGTLPAMPWTSGCQQRTCPSLRTGSRCNPTEASSDNLYVVDTSFLPSIGAVNPALTAMANALRVGDHLLARLGGA